MLPPPPVYGFAGYRGKLASGQIHDRNHQSRSAVFPFRDSINSLPRPNGGHAFHCQLRQLRKEANETARQLEIVSNEKTSRR